MKLNKEGYFVSIGGGVNQIPLIEACLKLGLKVITVDKNPEAPGFSRSHLRIYESVTEYRKIYHSIMTALTPDPILGIGCRSYGHATITTAYLSEKFELPGTPEKIIRKFYNKSLMKKFLGENGITVPKQYKINIQRGIPRLPTRIKFPVILRPVNSEAKRKIFIINSSEEFKNIASNEKIDSTGFFVEEFIEGNEYTALGLVKNGEFNLISISDKITTSFPPFLEISHRLPAHDKRFLGEIKLACQLITRLTKYRTGPMVAEFRASRSGEIYLVEAMPEIGGEFLADRLIPEYFSYNYFENYVKLMIGEEFQTKVRPPAEKKISHVYFYCPPEGKSKLSRLNSFVATEEEEVFFEKDLASEQQKLDTASGNSCRVKAVGITSKKILNHEVLDKNLSERRVVRFD